MDEREAPETPEAGRPTYHGLAGQGNPGHLGASLSQPETTTPDLLSRLQGALADRYRIERELGAGGMATVYLAHDLRHDRRSRSRSCGPSSPP